MLAAFDEGAGFTPQDSIDTAVRRMVDMFARAGVATPHPDARFLLQGLLGIDAAAFLRDGAEPLGEKSSLVTAAALRRVAREPVSRILGWREFYGRRFEITPDVLDPRPETETLVDLALELVASRARGGAPLSIIDIGTGSGAIVATMLAELPQALGLGTDVSAAALQIARINAGRLCIAERLSLMELSGVDGSHAPPNIVVSNPPYIPTRELAFLDPEVRDYDPVLALDGGHDGLVVYREIAAQLCTIAGAPPIVLEVGAQQAPDVAEIFENNGFELICQRNDLGGHVRAVAFRLRQ